MCFSFAVSFIYCVPSLLSPSFADSLHCSLPSTFCLLLPLACLILSYMLLCLCSSLRAPLRVLHCALLPYACPLVLAALCMFLYACFCSAGLLVSLCCIVVCWFRCAYSAMVLRCGYSAVVYRTVVCLLRCSCSAVLYCGVLTAEACFAVAALLWLLRCT